MTDRNQIERLRAAYPKGTEVELTMMKGESRMPAGLKGKVLAVDDMGQVHVSWENGSSLALNTDEDEFRKIAKGEPAHGTGHSGGGEGQQVGLGMGMS